MNLLEKLIGAISQNPASRSVAQVATNTARGAGMGALHSAQRIQREIPQKMAYMGTVPPRFNTALPQNNELNIDPQGFSFGLNGGPSSMPGNQLQPSGRSYEDEYTAHQALQGGGPNNGQVSLHGNFLQGMASGGKRLVMPQQPLVIPQNFNMYGMPGLSLDQPQYIQERPRMPYKPLNRI